MNIEHFCIWLMAFLFLCGIASIISSLIEIKKEIENINEDINENLIKLCNIQQDFCVFLMEYLKGRK